MTDSRKDPTTEYPHLKWFGIPKILPYAKPYRKMIVVMVLTGLFSSLEDTLYPLFNRYALDHFIGERTTDTLPVFIALYLAMMLAQTLVNILGVYLCSKVEIYVSRDLKNLSFNFHTAVISFYKLLCTFIYFPLKIFRTLSSFFGNSNTIQAVGNIDGN